MKWLLLEYLTSLETSVPRSVTRVANSLFLALPSISIVWFCISFRNDVALVLTVFPCMHYVQLEEHMEVFSVNVVKLLGELWENSNQMIQCAVLRYNTASDTFSAV